MERVNGLIPRRVIIRHAIRDEFYSQIHRKGHLYNLRSADERDLMRAVERYRRFHRTELLGFVAKHKERDRKHLIARADESRWCGNVLGNKIYKAYREALATNKFRHLRVRRNMLSIDNRNIIATQPVDYKVLAILKRRIVDNAEGPWY